MKTNQDLIKYFDQHHIVYKIYDHEPLYTVEQADALALSIPGGHIKNLFLKDDSGKLWLISAQAHALIDLKKVSQLLNARKLRFANADLLMQHLGVLPGSVTPFALINDPNHNVHFVLDNAILSFDNINAHPLENTATVGISMADFNKFLQSLGIKPIIIDFQTYTMGYNL